MGKALVIAGLIITILGISLFTMTSLNVFNINKLVSSSTCYPANCTQTSQIPSTSFSNGQISLFNGIIANLYQPYSQVVATIGIQNANSITPATYTVELLGQGQVLATTIITINPNAAGIVTLSVFFTNGLPGIPILMEPRFTAIPNIDFEIHFSSTSNSLFYILYRGEIINKLVLPLTLILTIVGLAIIAISLVLTYRKRSAARPRSLAYQSSLYEPTLFSSVQKNQGRQITRAPKTPSNRATRGNTPIIPKTASNVARCKSCQKPIPAKSQYCPHCYTRQ